MADLRTAGDARAATDIFTNKFLRPGIPGMDSRYKWTARALNLPSLADIPAPGASPASLQAPDEGQPFYVPGDPNLAMTEADVQRLEQPMLPPAATPREAVERAVAASGNVPLSNFPNIPGSAPILPTEALSGPAVQLPPEALPQTAPLPPVRPSLTAASGVVRDSGRTPMVVRVLRQGCHIPSDQN
jgi:hypothetical protein